MTLHIYGASDDLIEVTGAVEDEFYPPADGPTTVLVDAKTDAGDQVQVQLQIEYAADGTSDWRVTEVTGHGLVTITPARGEDEGNDEDRCPGYSDKATIRGGYAVTLG